MTARLRLEGVSLLRGGQAVLQDLSLALSGGRVLAILGPNGAGKTSLLMAMAGLLAPASGRVLLDGKALDRLEPRARGRAIGYLPQGGALAWNLAVREVVALGRLPHRGPFAREGEEDAAAVGRALEATATAHLAHRPILSLSGGERARVLLARVMAGNPSILLADEPLQNLDPEQQLRLVALLRGLAERGAAVAVVVHDLPLARQLADDALLLKDGRLLAHGPAGEILVPAWIGKAFGVSVTPELVPLAPLGPGG
ncbi:ABC transporter ATP-binding protein [Thermaurantiacus sp.]